MWTRFQFSTVQSLSRVQLFATPWIAACQASLSITNSWSSLKLTFYLILIFGIYFIVVQLVLCNSTDSIKEITCEKPRQHIKKQRHYFADKGPYSQSYEFSSSHVWIWQLDHKEGWAPKNWCFLTVVLEKTLESPLDSKEIKPVNYKGNQS